MQGLERDVPLHRLLDRQIHDPKAPLADDVNHEVSACDALTRMKL
jgi:hypothetical protein